MTPNAALTRPRRPARSVFSAGGRPAACSTALRATMLVALALALLVGGCGSGKVATSPEPAGGGSGWKAVKVNGVGILQGADFASAKDGWVVGQMTTAGSILATTDGGATWETQKAKLPELTAVSFANAWDGCAVGYGVVVTTSDGGAHWEIRKLNWAFEAVTFVNARDGWASGQTRGPRHH